MSHETSKHTESLFSKLLSSFRSAPVSESCEPAHILVILTHPALRRLNAPSGSCEHIIGVGTRARGLTLRVSKHSPGSRGGGTSENPRSRRRYGSGRPRRLAPGRPRPGGASVRLRMCIGGAGVGEFGVPPRPACSVVDEVDAARGPLLRQADLSVRLRVGLHAVAGLILRAAESQ